MMQSQLPEACHSILTRKLTPQLLQSRNSVAAQDRLTSLLSGLLLLEGASSNQQRLLIQQSGDQMGAAQTVGTWTSPLTQGGRHAIEQMPRANYRTTSQALLEA